MLGLQFPIRAGEFDYKFQKIIESVEIAKKRGEKLLVFPSFFLTGMDFSHQVYLPLANLIDSALKKAFELSHAYEGYMLLGAMVPAKTEWETKVFLVHHGQFLHVFEKSHKQQDIYYFLQQRSFILDGKRFGVLFFDELAESVVPREVNNVFDVCLVFAELPFFHGTFSFRKKILDQFFTTAKSVILINPLALAGEKLFDGTILLRDSNVYRTTYPFREGIYSIESDQSFLVDEIDEIHLLHDALVWGVREFFAVNKHQQAILGLSGGIDSAVVAVLASEALGSNAVKALILPSAFTSKASIEDAKALAEHLSMPYEIIPISEAYNVVLSSRGVSKELPELAEENLQARIRMLYLMYEANREHRLLLNTSNKSEILTGYGTLYGDTSGAISILGDVYKTEVYALAKYINQSSEVIPQRIVDKEPSAELRPNQKDSDSLPPYPVLDQILKEIFEEKVPVENLYNKYDHELLKTIERLVASSVFKRYQLPPKFSLYHSSITEPKKIYYPFW